MKNIKSYVWKKVLVKVNNQTEWDIFYPILNTSYKGWTSHHFTEVKGSDFYVDLYVDVWRSLSSMAIIKEYNIGWEIIDVSEFIHTSGVKNLKEEKIINDYSIC